MQKYYELLYFTLKKHGLLFNRKVNLSWRKDFQLYYECLKWDQELIENMQAEFGFDGKNVLLVNSKKIIMISDFYNSDVDVEILKSSVLFTLLGCLMDYLLDKGTVEQKEVARWKLSWEYCSSYFESGITARTNSVIDTFYQHIGESFQIIKRDHCLVYKEMIFLLKLSIDAELKVVNDQNIVSSDVIVTKSVIFVVLSIMISVYSSNLYEKARRIAYWIGESFAIIDDLCDIYEDIEYKQKNMVYEMMKVNYNQLSQMIDGLVTQIEEKLQNIAIYTNEIIYNMIKAEVQEWTMTNQYLRERWWSEND